MSARSAKQAAMQNAGLSVSDASVRPIPHQQRRGMGVGIQRQQLARNTRVSGGSEARLGDILVDLIRRVDGIESHIGSIGSRITEREQSNRTWLDSRVNQCEAVLWDRMVDLLRERERAPWTEQGHLFSQTYTQPAEGCWDGVHSRTGARTPLRGNTYSPESCASGGTNGLGYDDDYVWDCASPTPSELAGCSEAFVECEGIDGREQHRVMSETEHKSIAHTATILSPSSVDAVEIPASMAPGISQTVPGWEYAEPPALDIHNIVPEITVTRAQNDGVETELTMLGVVSERAVTLSVEGLVSSDL